MQKQLTITQELLAEVMPSYSEESAKACSILKDIKEVSQELDKELQRYLQQSGEKTLPKYSEKNQFILLLNPEWILEDELSL